MYSQTIFLSAVTSMALPLSDSAIKVFPFGNRSDEPQEKEKNSSGRSAW
jgi:hypothetical protein